MLVMRVGLAGELLASGKSCLHKPTPTDLKFVNDSDSILINYQSFGRQPLAIE
jgi:hypothetical protein